MQCSAESRTIQCTSLVRVQCSVTYLVIDAHPVEGDVDGVGGAVVVGLQEGLLVRPVPHHEVHYGPAIIIVQVLQHFSKGCGNTVVI